MDLNNNASGICRITCSIFCLEFLFFVFLCLGLAGLNCCDASKIAQTAQIVCFMVVFYHRLDV